MNIILMGNRPLAIKVFEFLISIKEINLFLILNPGDSGQESEEDSLLKKANSVGFTNYIQPKTLKNNIEVHSLIEKFKADIILSCSYEKIIPTSFLALSTFGGLNFHFAALPLNRGCLPIVWTIANGEQAGVTLHKIDQGIDTGEVIFQNIWKPKIDITAKELYYDAVGVAFDIWKNFFYAFKETKQINSFPQNDSISTYHPFVFPEDRWIVADNSCVNVSNLINALTFDPHPSSRILYKEKEFPVIGPAKIHQELKERSNDLIVKGNYLLIGCKDGYVEVDRERNILLADFVTENE